MMKTSRSPRAPCRDVYPTCILISPLLEEVKAPDCEREWEGRGEIIGKREYKMHAITMRTANNVLVGMTMSSLRQGRRRG